MDPLTEISAVYVGEFSELDVRFRGTDRPYRFVRDVPRMIPYAMKDLFENHGQFVVGDRLSEAQDTPAGATTTILVRRLGALGDVLTIFGAVMGIHRAAPGRYRFILQTSPQFTGVMRRQPGFIEVIDHVSPITLRNSIQRYFNLDSWFELDHGPNGPKDSRVDRTWYKLLGRQRTDFPNLKAEFPFVVPEAVRQRAWQWFSDAKLDPSSRTAPVIGVALSARSTTARTPNTDLTRVVCETLVGRGAHVVFVEAEAPGWARGPSYHHWKTDIQEAVAVFRLLDAAITPDSGSMWLAHCGATPLVYWGGSTPGTVKCAHHPLWPTGVKLIQTNDWIGCPSCYEFAEACGYKYTCLKTPDPERFVRESVEAALFLAAEKRRGAFQATPV